MKTIEKMSGNEYERLSFKEIDQMRRLLSLRPYVEAMENPHDIIAMLGDDDYFMNALGPLVRNIYCYFMKFHCFMRVLLILVKDLPHAPLGKHLRVLYPYCIGGDRCVIETEEFQKCWQYLALMSKQEVANLLEKCCRMMHEYSEEYCSPNDREVDRIVAEDARNCITRTMQDLMSFIETLSHSEYSSHDSAHNASISSDSQSKLTRQELKQKMLEKAQQSRSERSNELKKVLNYLRDVFGKYVRPASKGPALIELFVFSDHQAVQSSLKGAPRGAIHRALTNPQFYLQVSPFSRSPLWRF